MIAPDLLPLATPLDLLDKLPGNPRRGDIDAVAASYERFGQRKPIVARREVDGRGTVLAGNHQLDAALKLGWDSIAVVWVDDDDVTAKAFALADNRVGDLGEYDPEDLYAMIADVVAEDDALLGATAYTQADLDELLSAIGDVPVAEPPVGFPVVDEDIPTEHRCPKCHYTWSGKTS